MNTNETKKTVGRPKKEAKDKVSSTHSKFTITLSNVNKEFLLEQKSKGKIKNVSGLVNKLLDAYRKVIQAKKPKHIA